MTVLVTGGAGFIGSNFIVDWFKHSRESIVNLDKLTYAGNPANLEEVSSSPHYHFVKGSIGDYDLVKSLLSEHGVRAVINFAAESHVDRSIHGPAEFVDTNVVGTLKLLEATRDYWLNLPSADKDAFRFLHVSTDEVYGSLSPSDPPFNESNQYQPNSPYSASKASSDHLVRSFHHTFGLPVLTTNCSNNYGPYQFPEKLIPLVINNALQGKSLPIYGDGQQIRDWLFVSDHCCAIRRVLASGRTGEVYNVGGLNEVANIDIVNTICDLLDKFVPPHENYHLPDNISSYKQLIEHVKDRPGHDRRYAIDASKVESELGWQPAETFSTGIKKTVEWYLANEKWVNDVTSGAYKNWINKHYNENEK
ncbi:dTDP-glucose 4,6-dehydratase [Aurantivibrio plasticivorans]